MDETIRLLLIVFGVLLTMVSIAALNIWIERRGLAIWQDRYGPNRIGPLGLFQVVADMVKIFFKETGFPPSQIKLFLSARQR